MSDTAEVEKQASGSSFYAGMRVLPPRERAAMYAVYGFCRAVDDIADDERGARPERSRALDAWRADIASAYAGGDPGRAAGLVDSIRDYGLDQQDFIAVIDGMQMDVDEDIRAPDLARLDLYCDRVASAVGRLSVRIFGMDEGPGIALSHHLGRALQLTNILRDIDEDAAIGRLYLPCDYLAAAGIETSEPQAVIAHPGLDAAARRLAADAHEHYRQSERIFATRPKGRLAAPRLMSAVYGGILRKMEIQGWNPPRRRASIGKVALLWIVLRRGLLG